MSLLISAYFWLSVLARTLPQSLAKLPVNFEMAISTDSLTIPGWIYVGCITDNITNRTLANNVQTDNGDNVTIENCLYACQSSGYSYCGPEYGNQCWGDSSTVSTGEITDNGCTMPCQGDLSEICGGSDRVSLYKQTNVSNSTTPVISTSVPPSIEESPVTITMVTTIVLTTSTSLDATKTNTLGNSYSLTVVPEETAFITTIQSLITTTISSSASSTTPPETFPSPSSNKAASAHTVAIAVSTVIAALLLLGLGFLYLWLKRRKRNDIHQDSDTTKNLSDPMCAPTKPEWYDNGGGQGLYLGDNQSALPRFRQTSSPPTPGPPDPPPTPSTDSDSYSPSYSPSDYDPDSETSPHHSPQPSGSPEVAQPTHPTPPNPNQPEPMSVVTDRDNVSSRRVPWTEVSAEDVQVQNGNFLHSLENRVSEAWNREEARLMDMGALEGLESSEIQEAIMAELSGELRAAVRQLGLLRWHIRNNTVSVYTEDNYSRGTVQDFEDDVFNGDVSEWL